MDLGGFWWILVDFGGFRCVLGVFQEDPRAPGPQDPKAEHQAQNLKNSAKNMVFSCSKHKIYQKLLPPPSTCLAGLARVGLGGKI